MATLDSQLAPGRLVRGMFHTKWLSDYGCEQDN